MTVSEVLDYFRCCQMAAFFPFFQLFTGSIGTPKVVIASASQTVDLVQFAYRARPK